MIFIDNDSLVISLVQLIVLGFGLFSTTTAAASTTTSKPTATSSASATALWLRIRFRHWTSYK